MRIYKIPQHMKTELDELTQQTEGLLDEYKSEFVCTEGCSGCCETFLWNLIEIINVREGAKYCTTLNKLGKRIHTYNNEYHRRKKIMGELAEDCDVFTAFFKDLRCVFLYENRCLVYENRPLLCRLYASRNTKSCAGIHELPEEYHSRANDILMRVFILNSRFTQLYHTNCTIQGLPFRFLSWELVE